MGGLDGTLACRDDGHVVVVVDDGVKSGAGGGQSRVAFAGEGEETALVGPAGLVSERAGVGPDHSWVVSAVPEGVSPVSGRLSVLTRVPT